jgi:hypothetical protein
MNNNLIYFYLIFGVIMIVLVDDQFNMVEFKKGKYIRLALEMFAVAYFVDPLKGFFTAQTAGGASVAAVQTFATGISPF